MGQVYQKASEWGWIKSYSEETLKWDKALIEPGRYTAQVKVAEVSEDEVKAFFLKLDQLAMSRQNAAIAAMIAEEADSILLALRMVKLETKEPFAGILGAGANLDIAWLRPKDVGASLLNGPEEDNLGLYKGTSGEVYTWLSPLTENTSAHIIPEQTTAEEVTVVHLGAIDPIEVPKVNAISFTISAIPAPAQSCPFNIREGFGNNTMPFVRFEKPVIIGPEKKQKVELMPVATGDTKFQLLSFLIARAQDLSA